MRIGMMLAAALLTACTMPLPVDLPPSPGASGEPPPGSSGSSGGQSQVVPLDQVFIRSAIYQGRTIRYLDLNTCSPVDPSCINRLNFPLTTLIRYEFFFSDGLPVIGQNPVFNSPLPNEADTPFRRVLRVTVPDGYVPNTIRTSQDVTASQFRTEASNRLLNNPIIASSSGASVPLTTGRAWLQNREVTYLDLGRVPFSSIDNRPVGSVVYFMRNHDKTDLPSRPAPIFATVPGDLLYSPIRQVFRAVAEEQAISDDDDPSLGIDSEDELLTAIKLGVFRLETSDDEFFNYPVYQFGQSAPQTEFALSLASARAFPPLPAGAYYALWVSNRADESRLLLRFRAEGGRLQTPEGVEVPVGPGTPAIFSFSQSELQGFRNFLVSIEDDDVSQPTGSTLLVADYQSRAETELSVPFAPSYANLQTGGYLLAAPSARNQIQQQGSGVWFVQRSDNSTRTVPLNRDLEPGLIMSLPPRGWTYNGWVLSDLRNPVWLQTGPFKAVNQPDAQQRYLGNESEAYSFPGEDFLSRAPEGLTFPLELASTGERELVVSLEPEGLRLRQPFFSLYRTVLSKGTPELSNQTLPASPVSFPALRLRLEAR